MDHHCTGSKYSGKPVFLSSELRRCPITCEQVPVSYPAVCGRKNPPTIKLAHTLGWIERRERVCLSVRMPFSDVRVLRMGGADMLIYLLSPISTPSHLLTRGSAIPSVSINHAIHHLTSTACHHSCSSAAELPYPLLCHAVLHTLALHWPRLQRTGLGGISAKPSPRCLLGSAFLPVRQLPRMSAPSRAPGTRPIWRRPSSDRAS